MTSRRSNLTVFVTTSRHLNVTVECYSSVFLNINKRCRSRHHYLIVDCYTAIPHTTHSSPQQSDLIPISQFITLRIPHPLIAYYLLFSILTYFPIKHPFKGHFTPHKTPLQGSKIDFKNEK
jgi:hypothetical protein